MFSAGVRGCADGKSEGTTAQDVVARTKRSHQDELDKAMAVAKLTVQASTDLDAGPPTAAAAASAALPSRGPLTGSPGHAAIAGVRMEQDDDNDDATSPANEASAEATGQAAAAEPPPRRQGLRKRSAKPSALAAEVDDAPAALWAKGDKVTALASIFGLIFAKEMFGDEWETAVVQGQYERPHADSTKAWFKWTSDTVPCVLTDVTRVPGGSSKAAAKPKPKTKAPSAAEKVGVRAVRQAYKGELGGAISVHMRAPGFEVGNSSKPPAMGGHLLFVPPKAASLDPAGALSATWVPDTQASVASTAAQLSACKRGVCCHTTEKSMCKKAVDLCLVDSHGTARRRATLDLQRLAEAHTCGQRDASAVQLSVPLYDEREEGWADSAGLDGLVHLRQSAVSGASPAEPAGLAVEGAAGSLAASPPAPPHEAAADTMDVDAPSAAAAAASPLTAGDLWGPRCLTAEGLRLRSPEFAAKVENTRALFSGDALKTRVLSIDAMLPGHYPRTETQWAEARAFLGERGARGGSFVSSATLVTAHRVLVAMHDPSIPAKVLEDHLLFTKIRAKRISLEAEGVDFGAW